MGDPLLHGPTPPGHGARSEGDRGRARHLRALPPQALRRGGRHRQPPGPAPGRLQATAQEFTRQDGGDSTVSGVAQRWGFTDAAHFSRIFRAWYGISPSQWRDTRGGTEPSDGQDTHGPVS
ncbi:helix-turn-helix domain-containing protein [Streptomyces sp. CBMA156]|uniref:helix-turn-helix domain-containing protein n=1 Tax=Streptomyces sp. CBMA156 TaxID=1930280 RepID=UPI001CB7C241|nr:helix-turn-helix domain-containing protein [Streptomyces sp. CBMA156]